MLIGLIVVGGMILVAATVWLMVLNRASEALLSKGLGALVVGVVALLVTLLLTLKAPETKRFRFPVVFLVERNSLLPVRVPGLTNVSAGQGIYVPYVEVEPVLARFEGRDRSAVDSQEVETAYMDLLAAYVNEVLWRNFRGSWDVEVVADRVPGYTQTRVSPRQPLRPGEKTSITDLQKGLSASPLMDSRLQPDAVNFPPGTVAVWTETPRERVLRITNPFVRLTVTIERMMSTPGSSGFEIMMGLPRDEMGQRHMTLSFMLDLEAAFERLRSGHPNMPAYTRWADTFFSGLRAYDAEGDIATMVQTFRTQEAQEARKASQMLASAASPPPPSPAPATPPTPAQP